MAGHRYLCGRITAADYHKSNVHSEITPDPKKDFRRYRVGSRLIHRDNTGHKDSSFELHYATVLLKHIELAG